MMRYRWFLLFVVLLIALLAGCGKDSFNPGDGETSAEEAVTVRVPDSVPFSFNRGSVTKATVYLAGSDQIIAELTDSDNLNILANILDNARSFSGEAPADLAYTIVLESRDGIMRNLDVTGNGHVFFDQTTKASYELDKETFEEFVVKLKAATVKNFEPGIFIDFPPGDDADEQAVIALVDEPCRISGVQNAGRL